MPYSLKHQLAKEIFRAYDIRGRVDVNFGRDEVYTIGRALGSEAQTRGISSLVCGRDGRTSGPELQAALIEGIQDSGCSVVDCGEVTTPMLYFAAQKSAEKSGIMLSGSHNPPQYNGIKIVMNGEALFGEDIVRLYTRICEHQLSSGKGTVTTEEIATDYQEAIKNAVNLQRPLRVVVDCGNGIGGKYAPAILEELGCKVTPLFCEVDGTFPNHPADPAVPENLVALVAKVKEETADVGLAFDGDADRVGIVTNHGDMIVADRLLMLLARDFLLRNPGETVLFDVKCSRNLAKIVAEYHGQPLMYKTGHSLIKSKMHKEGIKLAGEMSGHIFMQERWLGFDDGIYVATRFLEILAAGKLTSSELFATIPTSFATPEIKIEIPEEQKFALMEKIKQETAFTSGKINTIDGLRVDYPDGFGLIRPSNTTPYLILRFEGDDEVVAERIKADFKRQLQLIDSRLVF